MSSGPDPSTEIQNLLHQVSLKNKRASVIYHFIRDANAPKLGGLKLAWERDIEGNIEPQQ